MKFGPPPPGPLGAIFRSFLGFLKKILKKKKRRKKLRGPLDKNYKNLGKKKFDPAPPPLASWGRFLGFF